MIFHANKTCLICGKVAVSRTELIVQAVNKKLIHLECGHTLWEAILPPTTRELVAQIRSNKGKEPYGYQCDGVQFIEDSNHKCLVADQMGLGKTIQALIDLKLHMKDLENVLIVCKASNIMQWFVEYLEWVYSPLDPALDAVPTMIFGTDVPYKQAKIMIVGYETLGLIEDPDNYSTELKKKRKNPEWLSKTCNFKTLIVDECQQIKNAGPLRTRAVQKIARKCDHVIALSGTPIKNRASEYFNILNLLCPKSFWNRDSFLKNYCKVEVPKGKKHPQYTGLKNPQFFHNATKHFIIRREREEVMPDLPKVFRSFSYSELGKQVKDAYVQEMKDFQDAYEKQKGKPFTENKDNLLKYLQRMRHLTGRAKVIPTAEFVADWLDEQENGEKIVVFVHHRDVAESLGAKIQALTKTEENEAGEVPLFFTSSLNSTERYARIEEFKNNGSRVLISSTQAVTGMNMQFCGTCIMMERQWSPTDEEQAEDRFPRPGTKHEKIFATYMTAIGTIDEFFADLVEQKRVWIKSALAAGKITAEQATEMLSENSLMKELMEILAAKGLRKWEMGK